MIDHYETLGVSRSAEDIVIKAAYRALSQRYHPDRVADGEKASATETMAAINRAYEVLSDRKRRAAYDAECRQARSGARADEPPVRPQQPFRAGAANHSAKRVWLLIGACLAIWVFGFERKSAWTYGWDLISSGFADTSHYQVHWLAILCIVLLVWRLWRRWA